MRTVATFSSSAFNVSEPRDYFINPECFGDDLAAWLASGLDERGAGPCGAPRQEDFGWYFDFETPDGAHCCVLGYRPEERPGSGRWVLWLERTAGFLGSMLGRRKRVMPVAARLIHEVLQESPEIEELGWHERRDFDRGREDLAARTPE